MAVVDEKEHRLKQTLKISGLTHASWAGGWYATALLQFFLIAVLCAGTTASFMIHTSFALLLAYVTLFCVGVVSFCLLVSVFFSNAKLAAVLAPILFFGAVLPKYVFFGSNRYERTTDKLWASLLLPSAFSFGADILADYEYAEIGVTLENMHEGDYSFASCLLMLCVDTALYTLLYLYLERVLPSRYGSREHPLFFLIPSWWLSDGSISTTRAALPRGAAFEPVDAAAAARPSIEVVGLTKAYGSGRMRKVAVDDLSLSFAEGQISCLLGHNGAGKTTTLAIVTGLYPPTKGDAYVYGYSVTRAVRKVYSLLGICPQHDVLFGRLTVFEHLELYAALRRVPSFLRRTEARKMASEIGLANKGPTRSRALSGGMKRKLSVGNALIGGSKAVLLDEPTSGMDPASRRSLWELLQRQKAERVLVLTTHYMDEADVLADRIAVMSAGKLTCCGSSLFLKARFGLGYSLTMVRASSSSSEELAAAVHRHVAGAAVLSEAGGELSFRLPRAAAP